MVDLTDDSTYANTAGTGEYYYLSCVKQGQLNVLPSSVLQAVANGDDKIKVKVQVKEAGEIKPNTWVSATATSDYVTFANPVVTNSEGVAEFNLTSYKAESFYLDISVNSVQTRVRGTFEVDSSNAKIRSIATVATAPYSTGPKVVIILTDDNNNPIKGIFLENSSSKKRHPDTGEIVQPILVHENSHTDVNGQVSLRVEWNENYQIPTEDMTFTIYSEFGNALDSSRVTFQAPSPPPPPTANICGGQVGDDDKTNAKGDCIKVVENGGKLYTGTPSVSFLQAIDFAEYSKTLTEHGYYGPAGGGAFALFTHSEAGQLCTQYNNINLQGKSNWRLATKDELMSLYHTYSKMYDAKGWATTYPYWSSTPDGHTYYRVSLLLGGDSSTYGTSSPHYASCVSGS